MSEIKKYCIMCPIGCEMYGTKNEDNSYKVVGNGCVRGKIYFEQEMIAPMRNITTLVRYKGGVAPVRSVKPIPKDLIFEANDIITDIELDEKPQFHQVIVKNILNTGVDIIAT